MPVSATESAFPNFAARCLLMDKSVLSTSALLRIAEGALFVVILGAARVTD